MREIKHNDWTVRIFSEPRPGFGEHPDKLWYLCEKKVKWVEGPNGMIRFASQQINFYPPDDPEGKNYSLDAQVIPYLDAIDRKAASTKWE